MVVMVGLHEEDWLAPWRRNGDGGGVVQTIVLALLWNQRRRDQERAFQHQILAQNLEALGHMTAVSPTTSTT